MSEGHRLYAGAWGLAGIIWVVNGLTGLGAADGTPEFYVMASAFIPAHLLVLVGLVGLLREGLVDGTTWGRAGLYLAMVGRLAFITAEAILVARGYEQDLILLPIAAMSTAIGMLVAGVAAMQVRRWRGWARIAPLTMGGYPFVFMFPLLAITGQRPNVAVSLWGLTYLGISAAFLRQAARPPAKVPASA